MTKRMLIDAAQSEEVRVVVVDEDRIEELEIESMSKEQLRGNVYIAEVSRVEPSLQAAFVNFGSERNGFLAFSEIHPQYFDVPEDEKRALLEELDEIAERRKARARRLNGEDDSVEASDDTTDTEQKAKSASQQDSETKTDNDDTEDNKPKHRKTSARKAKAAKSSDETEEVETEAQPAKTSAPAQNKAPQAKKPSTTAPKSEEAKASPAPKAAVQTEEPVITKGVSVTQVEAAPDVAYTPKADESRPESKNKAKGVKQVEEPELKTSGIVVETISADGEKEVSEKPAKEKPIAADVKEDMVEEAIEEPKAEEKPKRRRTSARKTATKAKKDAEETATEAKAEVKTEATPEEQTEATESEEKPKRRRAPRKKAESKTAPKKSKADTDAEDSKPEVLEEEIIDQIDADLDAEDNQKDASAKSKTKAPRRSSSRRKMEERLEKRHEAQKAQKMSKDEELEEELEEQAKERPVPIHRRYNIADVIKPGQKIIVQVMKETRGNKGAALTTNISLPGRFTVLMPNTPFAGGISRKISDYEDRKSLKEAYNQIDIPNRMGLIVRTAGVGQDADALRKDMNHLMSHWKNIQHSFEKERAPKLVHEDSSIVVRCLRDMMGDDIDEVVISGRKAFHQAKDYCNALIPEKAGSVKEHRGTLPLFSTYKVESLLHELAHTRADLPSGGYLIINPTEALVSIDVNSGRSTGESNVESTALHTNLEAAEEVARQLRLRDLSGLIVIDFIDMDDRRNERKVERKLRDALRKDRARTQTAHISDFGLLEMSRQRLRPSIGETSFDTCPHCNGKGLVRSSASAALMILRDMQEELVKAKHAHKVIITTSSKVSLYILNHKRKLIHELEKKYDTEFIFQGSDRFVAPDYKMEVLRQVGRNEKSHTVERILREDEEGLTPSARRRQRQEAKQRQDQIPMLEQDDNQQDQQSAPEETNNSAQKEAAGNRTRTPSKSKGKQENTKGKKPRRYKKDRSETDENLTDSGSEGKAEAETLQKKVSQEQAAPEASEQKPKPRKRRSRKVEQSEDRSEQTTSSEQPTPAAEQSTPEQQSELNTEAEEKPKRRRSGYLRRNKKVKPTEEKTAEPVAKDTPQEQPSSVEATASADEKPKRRRGRPPKKKVEDVA